MSDGIELQISQGKNWSHIIQWPSRTTIFKPITAASQAAPCVLTVPAHGLQSGWLFTIEGCQGMAAINSRADLGADVQDPDTLVLGDRNALSLPAYTGGGVIRYALPTALDDLTPRMQIRASLTSTDVLLQLDETQLVVDLVARWITLQLTPTASAALSFDTAVFDLEMVDANGLVPLWASGTVTLEKEVTR